MQCRILHWSYWTNQKLQNCFLRWNLHVIAANQPQLHLFSCSSCPLLAIFVVSLPALSLSKTEAMFLTQRLILLKWKDTFPPSFTQWVHDLLFFIKLEKIKYSLRGEWINLIKYGTFFSLLEKTSLNCSSSAPNVWCKNHHLDAFVTMRLSCSVSHHYCHYLLLFFCVCKTK